MTSSALHTNFYRNYWNQNYLDSISPEGQEEAVENLEISLENPELVETVKNIFQVEIFLGDSLKELTQSYTSQKLMPRLITDLSEKIAESPAADPGELRKLYDLFPYLTSVSLADFAKDNYRNLDLKAALDPAEDISRVHELSKTFKDPSTKKIAIIFSHHLSVVSRNRQIEIHLRSLERTFQVIAPIFPLEEQWALLEKIFPLMFYSYQIFFAKQYDQEFPAFATTCWRDTHYTDRQEALLEVARG